MMIPQNRHYKRYTIQVGAGATYNDFVLDIGGDLAAKYGVTAQRFPATSAMIYFDGAIEFKANSLLADSIPLDANLMGGARFEFAYGDMLLDKLYFGINTEGTTVTVMCVCFA